MSDFQLTCNGQAVIAGEIHTPAAGPWYADLTFADEAAPAAGKATLVVGSAKLSGTILDDRSGTFAIQRKARLVGGGGGWGTVLPAKAYRNDAGVKAVQVASDAAREAGETLDTAAAFPTPFMGTSYVRKGPGNHPVPASRALEDACAGTPWWVGYDGITHVGARPAVTPAPDSYGVLSFDPLTRVIELDVDDITLVPVGSTLTARLDAPQVVRSLVVRIREGSIRLLAYCGNEAHTRIADALRAIVERTTDEELHGTYRYRVVAMNGDQVDLQAMRKRVGVPDLVRTAMWPGASGIHNVLTPGTECAVVFLDGDRTQPAIIAFAGRTGPNAQPATLELCGNDLQAARMGDLTQAGGPGTIVTLTPVAALLPGPLAPALGIGLPYMISFDAIPPSPVLAAPLYGAVVSGHPRVKLGAS